MYLFFIDHMKHWYLHYIYQDHCFCNFVNADQRNSPIFVCYTRCFSNCLFVALFREVLFAKDLNNLSNMDTLSSTKMTALAASQYASNANENTKAQLLRHTEVLLALLKTKEVNTFLRNSDTSKDCVMSLIEVLSNCNKNKDAMCTIFKLFNVIYDIPYSQKLLFEHVDINSLLMKYVVEHAEHESLDSMQDCLELLQKTTQNGQLNDMSYHVDKFLQCLLDVILKNNSSNVPLCLGILNNLVSSNIVVQAQVKGMLTSSNLKQMMTHLRQGSISNQICVLSIIVFICWDDDIAKKFFSINNVTQTMKLIFSQLIASEDLTTQQRAGSICIELLRHDEISRQFAIYDSEHNIVYRLLMNLQKNLHEQTVAKSLEVLLAFCQVSTIRHSLCMAMMKSENSWFILLKIAASPLLRTDKEPSILVTVLLGELCEEINDSNISIAECTWFNELIGVLAKHLKPIAVDENDFPSTMLANADLTKKLKTILILNMLVTDEPLSKCVSESLDFDSVCSLLNELMSKNMVDVTRLILIDAAYLSCNVVLQLLELIRNLKARDSNMEKLLYTNLQDSRIVSFLAKGMTSCDRSQLQVALKLHQEAFPLPNFPSVQLAEMIAYLNEKQKSDITAGNGLCKSDSNYSAFGQLKSESILQQSKDVNSSNFRSSIKKSGSGQKKDTEADKENIHTLIASLQAGDEESKEDDVNVSGKTSEIVTMYENKISSLITSKNNLQDLLEAKTLALAQADRINSQNRIQLSKSEEDTRKMAEILRNSESCCERLTETLRATECDRNSLKCDLETVVEDNRHLQKVADQYDKMQVAFQDNMHKSEVLERNLQTSRQEYDTLKELHDMIQRHNETLKKQHNQISARLEDVEGERMKLLKRVAELESSVSDLTQLVEEQDRATQKVMQEKMEQDNIIKSMHIQLSKLEESNRDFKIEKSQLTCCLREREEELANMKQTLEKQAQTLSMITELANAKHRPH